MDFSEEPELAYLAELVAAVQRVAHDVPFFLAGATARDLLFRYAYGIDAGRETRDIDLALAVENWGQFHSLRAQLLEDGRFKAIGNVLHKLSFDGWLEVDVVPFGAIERPDRTIAWPPDGAFVMKVFGFREVFDSTLHVQLPAGEEMRIVSVPALAILKLAAWTERRLISPMKDAHDLAVILRNYLDAGNHDRLYAEAAHLLEAPGFDFELAGAWLLGHDMARILPPDARRDIATILNQESDPNGPTRLVGDMPIKPLHGLHLLQSLARGFMETSNQ